MKPVNVYTGKLLNIAKLTLLSGTICFIIYKLFIAYDMDKIATGFVFEWTLANSAILALTLLLMVFNWWLESLKWRIIMRKYEPVTALQSWKSVCTGIALSIITPNQVGDFIGKAVFLKSFDKIKGAVISLLGGFAQTLVSATVGLICLWWLVYDQQYISLAVFIGGYIGIAAIVATLIFIYFHIHWLEKLGRWQRIKDYVTSFTLYGSKELTSILLLALCRFCTFSFQYFLLLQFFNVPISLIHAFICICAIFLVQGFLPSFILVQIGVRGATALFFFGLFVPQATAGILLAAYSLWIINMMLPGMLGLYYLLRLKWSNPL